MSRQLLVLGVLLASPALAQTGDRGYRVGVVSESGDVATWLKPVGDSLAVDRRLDEKQGRVAARPDPGGALSHHDQPDPGRPVRVRG